jgi:hypothetical protein
MKRSVTFKTRVFANKEPQPHFINPRCFGEDVAAWLLQQLQNSSWSLSEPIQEDYGWGFWAKVDKNTYWVAIGIMDEAIGADIGEWCVTVADDPGLNLIRRLFHKSPPGELLDLCRAIDAALHDNPDIAEIQWWSNEPFVGSGSAYLEPEGAAS